MKFWPFTKPQEFAADKTPTEGTPTVWTDSVLYSGTSLPQYNPDTLIGRKGYAIYRQMMQDEQLKAVVHFRRNSVTGRRWSFMYPDDHNLSDDEADRRVKIMTAIVQQMPGSFSERLNGIMSAMWQGFSLTEKVLTPIEFDGRAWFGIKSLRTKPFDTFIFNSDQFGELLQIKQTLDGQEQIVNPANLIHHVYNSEIDEYYGSSELREAYRAWFSKDITIRFQNIYLERMAGGLVWAKLEKGSGIRSGTREWNALTAALSNLQTKTSIIAPAGVELNVEHPSGTSAYGDAIVQHDKSLAKALLVPNLMGISEQGSTGSFAQSQTQLEAFLWMLEAEARRLEETLNEQLFRELGDLNFGDGQYPRFRFRQLSEQLKGQIIEQWNSLVESGSVKGTTEDENHLRQMMDFPIRSEDDEPDQSVRPDTALNGAQITSLLDVVTKVRVGDLEMETGVEVITKSFPISREEAETMLGTIEVQEAPAASEEPETPDTGGDDEELDDHGTEGEIPDDEILGSADDVEIVAAARMTKAMRRVNFAAIDQSATVIEGQFTDALGATVDELIAPMVAEFESVGMGGYTEAPELVRKLTPKPADISAIKKVATAMLRDSWSVGERTSQQEMKRAGAQMTAKFADLGEQAAAFFGNRSFEIAGKLSDKGTEIVRQEIMQGIKAQRSTEEVKERIYLSLANEGIISIDEAEEQLGDLLGTINASSRLETVIRTTSFEAINESRTATFEDPALGGFVTSYEYSAILDSRTTPICRALGNGVSSDGAVGSGHAHVHPTDDGFWNINRPPNHFNCRSLRVAVTQVDEIPETTDSVIDPQTGAPATPLQGFD